MPKALKLGPSLTFSILKFKLFLEFPLELIPCVNRIGSSSDFVTPVIPPNESNIFTREGYVAHLLSIILNAYFPKIWLKSLEEVIDLSCTPSLMEGRRP